MAGLELLRLGLAAAGLGFFAAGTAGLLRFPDVFTRLHALTKCDNLGLGFIALAVILGVDSAWVAAKVVLAWVLVLWASATACYLVARAALRMGVRADGGGR